MQGLDTLPPWAQVVLSVLVFLFGAFAWVRGMFFRPGGGHPSKDVVVPSVTIADSAALLGMADTLREASRVNRDRAEFERDILSESRKTNDLLEEIKYILGRAQRQERVK